MPDRRPKILFERHIFHKRTKGRYSAAHPDISSSASGGYQGDAAEYERLERAIKLDRKAALESVSWGLGQIMGFNAVKLGYLDAEDMVKKFIEGEDQQLDGSRRFIMNNAALESAFQNKNWTKVAFFYNGAAYAKNAYHTKLEHYCELYTIKGTLASRFERHKRILPILDLIRAVWTVCSEMVPVLPSSLFKKRRGFL